MPKDFEFLETNDSPLTLQSVVGQAMGFASVAWDNPENAGVFHSNEAVEALDATVSWIESHYEKKKP